MDGPLKRKPWPELIEVVNICNELLIFRGNMLNLFAVPSTQIYAFLIYFLIGGDNNY